MLVGVCGLGYTGSGAVLDLLREYEDCSISREDFEFDIVYCPHGIQDLEYHLMIKNARYLSSDAALREFIKLIFSFDSPKSIYRRITGKKFRLLSLDYINEITQIKWKGYADVTHKIDGWFYRRVRCTIYGRIANFLERYINIPSPLLPWDKMYLSVSPDDFEKKTKEYIQELVVCLGYDLNKIVILNQPFEGNEPENSMKYFDDPKAIVVDRDPRDVFVLAKKYLFSRGSFMPTEDVKDFIRYWKLIRKRKTKEESQDILKIRFEDLIYQYEDTVASIENFLKIRGKTSHKFQFFNPDISINNTQLFLHFPELKDDIKEIENELTEYLYPFERYKRKPIHVKKPF